MAASCTPPSTAIRYRSEASASWSWVEEVRSGRPDRRPVFSRFTPSGVVWDDGVEEAVDAVILATGYRPNLDYLRPLGALREDGRPDQRGGVSRAVPGLYFVGLPLQTSFSSPTLRGVGPDAAFVVARARRHLAHGVVEPTSATSDSALEAKESTGRVLHALRLTGDF